MIDLATESLLSLSAARAWLAERGVKRHLSALYRWVEEGRLETVEVGGVRFTSVQALQRMAGVDGADAARPKHHRRRTIDRRRYEEATARLEAAGW